MQKGFDKRMRCSWLLLLVYIPMLLAVTLHHHGGVQAYDARYYCTDCAHNIHHSGHLVQLQHTAHPCVLCQFQNTLCVVPVFILGMVYARPYRNTVHRLQVGCLCRACSIFSTRAPPYDTYSL